ncbi:MAG: sodium-dependent transporter [Bacteroidaceae bacterium]|nr:sodium-dependent transporter [Bacteroidaceae bacterium]
MSDKHANSRESFTSKIGVVLATAGSAVGLGNIWRFPTEVGQNGGAAFIIIYIACVAFFGLPLMLSEFLVGRHTHANTADAYRLLAPTGQWKRIGQGGVLVAWIILSYYIVVAGWTLYYTGAAVLNQLTAEQDFSATFSSFVADPWLPILCMAAFMLLTHAIVVRGVKGGIEKSSKLMMPMLLGIILILVVCSFSMPGTKEATRFLFKPDFSAISAGVILSALGQAFFSLSIAMGCLCTYASYFGRDVNMLKTAGSVCLIDTLVAVTAGFIIFPAVFSVPGVEPDAGPGLVFVTLPYVFQIAFHSVPAIGYVFSIMFYILLLLAALTSSIGLLEVPTLFVHEHYNISRPNAARIVTATCLILGSLCALSFGPLSDVTLFGKTVFDLFDSVSSTIMIPIIGMLTCVFIGWRLDRSIVRQELTNDGHLPFPLLRPFIIIVKYIAPLIIAAIFINQLL